MAVEIHILSGARQDERIVLDKTNFRAGSNPESEVFFDPLADIGTENRSASFQLLEDGWYIARSTGSIHINQREVAGPTRIRSGDVVRMSETGPDFSFSIVSNSAAKQTKSFGQRVPKPFTGAITPPVTTVPGPSAPEPHATAPIPAPSAAAPISAGQNTAKIGINERWILWGAGGLAFCIFFALLICVFALTIYVILKLNDHGSGESGSNGSEQHGKTNIPTKPETGESRPPPPTPIFTLIGPTSGTYTPGQPITITWKATNVPANNTIKLCLDSDNTLDNGNERWIEEDKVSAANGDGSYTFDCSGFATGNYYIGGSMKDKATGRKWNSQLTSYITITSKPEQISTEDRIVAQIKDAVFLLELEKAGGFWPVATCTAIGKHTLLTTAWEASSPYEREKDPKSGCKLWITNPASDIKMAVRDIRVHAVFTAMEDKPGDWIYYDLALLTVAEDLPNTIQLASPEEITKLEKGQPIYCFGFSAQDKEITKFSKFPLQHIETAIFIITAPPNLPAHPRLLHIQENIFKNACGSPIVNDQGRLVAVYGSEAMPEHPDPDALKIHYAPVFNPDLIKLGLDNQDSEIWISPDFNTSGAEPKDKR